MMSSVDEGGPIEFTIQASGTFTGNIRVSYGTQAVTATDCLDYMGTSGEVTLTPMMTFQSVSVSTLSDLVSPESPETFDLALLNILEGDATIGTATSRLSINNVAPPGGPGGTPTGDLDLVYYYLTEIAENLEDTPGGFPLLNDDDDDTDGLADNADTNGVSGENDTMFVVMRPAMNSQAGAKYGLEFPTGNIRLWRNAAKTIPVVSGAFDFDAGSGATVYAEAIGLGGGSVEVELYWQDATAIQTLSLDTVSLTPADVDLQIFQAGIVDPSEPAVAEALEVFPGAATFENLDNDDDDGMYDFEDTDGVVLGDNELAKLRVRVTPPQLAGMLGLQVTPDLRLWTTPDKAPGSLFAGGTNVLLSPPSGWASDGTFRYREFAIEGLDASNATADERIELQYHEPTNVVDSTHMTVLGIDRVEWLGISNSFNNDHFLDDADLNWRSSFATFAGNQRVFPDARWDGAQVGDARDEVFLQVTLSTLPPVPVSVYLRSFDVDDPSADSNVVDDESTADDNRDPFALQLGAGSSRLDFGTGDWQRSTHFGVSLHPGDNYRVVASADEDFLTQLENDDRAFTGNADKQRIVDPQITHPAGNGVDQEVRKATDYVSPTLTVWRLLNTELDTIPALGDGNTVVGSITGISGLGSSLRIVTVTNLLGDDGLDLNDSATEYGRFENGTLTVGQTVTGGAAITITNVVGNGDYFVEVRTAPSAISIAGLAFDAEDSDYFTVPDTMQGTITEITPVGGGYELTLSVTSPNPPWSDMAGGRIKVGGGSWVDVLSENPAPSTVVVGSLSIPFTLHDDDVDALLPYSTSALHPIYQAAYQDAYIEPVLITGADSELLAWQLNVLPEQLGTFVESEFTAFRDDEFWVAYNMWIFQFHEEMDYDSSAELASTNWGTGRGWTDATRQFSGTAVETTK
jgi:hypothetical protein